MRYQDRRHAGGELATALEEYRGRRNTVVLGLARGGVEVAFEVAQELQLPLDLTCSHKIGAPSQPELAIGAVTETGEGLMNSKLIQLLGVPEEYIQEQIERRTTEAEGRLKLYRPDRPPRDLKGKTVIIIDDGLATGSTMKAAIMSAKVEGAKEIIVAVPVGPPDTVDQIKAISDRVVCLQAPASFMAVGQYYQHFEQTPDDLVIELMKAAL